MAIFAYTCTRCGRRIETGKRIIVCPACGGNLDLDIGVSLPPGDHMGVWRFASSLPKLSHRISLGEGGTPLLSPGSLAWEVGVDRLMLKDETRNPTGTFIDRGAAVAVSAALEFGASRICCRGRGNLCASLAAYAAAAGLKCYVELDGPTDSAKLYQIVMYGAELGPAEGYAVCARDPFLLAGYRTLAYELLLDIGHAPDVVVAPAGHGSLVYSIYRGFRTLLDAGYIDSMPRIYAAQEEACNPIARAFAKGLSEPIQGRYGTGMATDLDEPSPAWGAEAIRAAVETDGAVLSVSRGEILEAMKLLARRGGVLAEPASAVALAALVSLRNMGEVGSREEVVVIVTGSGLKTKYSVRSMLGAPRSTAKLEILKVLDKAGEAHGYAVWKMLKERGFDLTKPAVYQHLKGLERSGLLSSRIAGRIRYYSLTTRGRNLLRRLGVKR